MDDPIRRALREIGASLKGRYDREAVREYLREAFRQNIEERNAETGEIVSRAVIDEQVEQGASEFEKVIWEGLDSALAMGINALMMTAGSVYLPTVGRRVEASESKVREQMHAKSVVRDQIIDTLLDPWLEQFSPLFSHSGRPPNNLGNEELDKEREQFIQDLIAAIEGLKIVDRGNIGLKLGYGKSRSEGLQPNKPGAAKALREKANRLGVNVDDLIREHRTDKK
jgi:hypothetical protein